MGAGAQAAEPRLEDAGDELAVQILKAHRHLGIVDLVAARGVDEGRALGLRAVMVDEEAEVLLERMGEIDGVHQARLEQAVLDLADRAGRHARDLGEAVDGQALVLAQLAQAQADILDVVFDLGAGLEPAGLESDRLGHVRSAAGQFDAHGRPMR